jgi:lipopolysaccharide biosynthesis glycosyltransferase
LNDFHIALCCSNSLLPGLHGTVASLTRTLGQRDKVILHLFLTGIDQADQERLRQTVMTAGGVGSLQFHQADLSEFDDFNALHGDRTVYLRLKLPELLPEAETILYLDSDLAVNLDVCEIFALPLGDAFLGAVPGETVAYTLDHACLLKLGLSGDDRYFNSGVLYFNAVRWRESGMTAQVLEVARKNPTLLRTVDQTILNYFFSRTFCHLPARFNIQLTADARTIGAGEGIYHFVGSPKPWDPLGSLIHGNFRIWQTAIKGSPFRWTEFLWHHAGFYVARAWAVRFSYLRVVKNSLVRIFTGKRG